MARGATLPPGSLKGCQLGTRKKHQRHVCFQEPRSIRQSLSPFGKGSCALTCVLVRVASLQKEEAKNEGQKERGPASVRNQVRYCTDAQSHGFGAGHFGSPRSCTWGKRKQVAPTPPNLRGTPPKPSLKAESCSSESPQSDLGKRLSCNVDPGLKSTFLLIGGCSPPKGKSHLKPGTPPCSGSTLPGAYLKVVFDLGAGDLPSPPPPDVGEAGLRVESHVLRLAAMFV